MLCEKANFRIKRVISIVLLISFLFALTGCRRKVPYIKPDKLIASLENCLDIEEITDYDGSGYHVSRSSGNSSCLVSGIVSAETGYIKIDYKIYDKSSEATEYFRQMYESYTEAPGSEDFSGYITSGNRGYLVIDDGDFFLGLYCVKDMVLSIDAHSEEQVDEAKGFLEELGLPID